MAVVKLAAEGIVDFAVLRRLTRDAGLRPGEEYGRLGKSHFDQRIRGYNSAAKFEPWLAARDLDNDAACAGKLARELLPKPAKLMCFRIVVRSVEAWLLADGERLAEAFQIPTLRVPKQPEAIDHPKTAMLCALQYARSKDVRSSMVRDKGGRVAIGPEYNARLSEFAEGRWRPGEASKESASLKAARLRLRELASNCDL